MIVIDVCAAIPYILFEDEVVQQAILISDRIVSPDLYVPECGNTILKYFNKDLISKEEATIYLEKSIDIIDHFYNMQDNAPDILKLAYENKLTFYDAQYLFLAKALKGKLLTRDQKLNKIAEKYKLKY